MSGAGVTSDSIYEHVSSSIEITSNIKAQKVNIQHIFEPLWSFKNMISSSDKIFLHHLISAVNIFIFKELAAKMMPFSWLAAALLRLFMYSRRHDASWNMIMEL